MKMRKKKTKIIMFLALFLIFSGLSSIFSFDGLNGINTVNSASDQNFNYMGNYKNLKISGYWSTNFIHVDGNWSETAFVYDWCSGDGSWGNPYTIENVTIDASTSPTGSGIFIYNSKNEYFIIRKCKIYNAGSETDDAGIRLENSNNGSILGNNCSLIRNNRGWNDIYQQHRNL